MPLDTPKVVENKDLIEQARRLINPKKLNGETIAGEVGSVLLTSKGNIFKGISLHASCGIGVCGEHTAIGNMLTNGETRIQKIVAVAKEGILKPCGRCRELMYQVDKNNADTEVIVDDDRILTLRELLPEYWQV